MNRDTDRGRARRQRFLRELESESPDWRVGVGEVAAFIALGLACAPAVLEAVSETVEVRVASTPSPAPHETR